MTKVTKEMINAAHDVTMKSKLMLGHELLEKIYLAMYSQRTWVGLTDEELSILGESFTHPDEGINEVDFGMEIQRILKEKNT